MADFTNLKDEIKSKIKSNGKQEITGAVLQQTMLEMIDETDRELTELSEEIGGKVYFQTPVNYKNQQFEIFKNLEKGKTYTFISSALLLFNSLRFA